MSQDIPCKYCGRYYGHKNSCVSWLLDTGVADKIRYEEFKQRYSKELYDTQKELSQARKLIAELVKAAEDFELRENHAEWCLIKKQYGGGCNCMDEKAYSLHECSARRDNRPSLPEEEFVIKELGFKE